MDSLDLLTQSNAYPTSHHHQYHHQDQQMNITDEHFQDKPPYDPAASGDRLTAADDDGGSRFSDQQERDSSSIDSSYDSKNQIVESAPTTAAGELDSHISSPDETNTDHTSSIYHHHQTGQNREIESKHQVLEDKTNDQQQEEEAANDDETFVALCTDASSVLNNDPTRRYYINKLYQPMNAQQDDSLLVEQDDEYLLYQELRFLESTAQELTDDRQQRVQLTKILEDDDDELDGEHGLDEDDNDNYGTREREDPLDRLQLATIIEGFDSFPSSPLIDTCHGGDPLISEASEHQQDKPDSTRHGDVSPASCSGSSSGSGHNDRITSNFNMPSMANQHNQHHQEFDCDQDNDLQQHLGLSHKDEDHHHHHTSHFLSMNHESHHHLEIDHHHQQQQYSHQMDQDNSSEISCFQQVSSTYMSLAKSNKQTNSSEQPPLPTTYTTSFETQQEDNQQRQQITASRSQTRQPRKRCLQQVDEGDNDDEGEARTTTTSSDEINRTTNSTNNSRLTKNRVKKKRTCENVKSPCLKTNDSENNNSSPSPNNVTSTIMLKNNTNIITHIGKSNIYTTTTTTNDNYQQEHITMNNDDHERDNFDEGDMSTMEDDDETTSSINGGGGGGRRHPHMSKYRRRTANARERIRMREINQAFEKLKKVVPIELIQQSMSGDESDQTSVSSRRGGGKSSTNGNGGSDSQSVKLTKITTLRLAVSYIAKLSEVLNQHPEGDDPAGDGSLSLSAIVADDNNDNATSGTQTRTTTNATKSRQSIEFNSAGRKRSRARSARKHTDEQSLKGRTNRASTTNKVFDVVGRTKQQTADQLNNEQQANNRGLTERRLSVEPTTIVLNQGNQRRHQHPIIITNNVLNGALHHQQSNATFTLPIQQHQQKQQQQQQQPHQQQFAYAHCNQQPLTISQTTTNGQDRTFVTPVAVAILGIQTGNNQGVAVDQPQALQLLGIQSPQQLRQRPQHQHHGQPNGSYNLVAHHQQPQQVTLTLDDINGLSVLRLTNPHNNIVGSQQTIQLQQGRPIVHQQPQILATTTTNGYNYAAYQPIHISQVHHQSSSSNNNNMTATAAIHRPIGQQTTTIQFHQDVHSPSDNNSMVNGDIRAINDNTNQQDSSGNDNQQQQMNALSTIATTTDTGNNSDCRNFGISPNMIAQHLNNNNVVQATQFKIQQSNCSGHILPNNLVTVSPGTQLFQTQAVSSCNGVATGTTTTRAQTNLIYINPPTSLSNTNGVVESSSTTFHQHHHQQQPPIQPQMSMCNSNNINTISYNNQPVRAQKGYETQQAQQVNTGNNDQQFEQMKFVTHFSSQVDQRQDKSFHANEANICQLVASLATSIHPNSVRDKQNKTNYSDKQAGSDQINNRQQQQPQQQQQQTKRTYRFHNYDGNMITNHLYSNNNSHDKQSQQQQSGKRNHQQSVQLQSDQQQQSNSQRSRQNSLSSTCSTTSSSSSSLTSLSSASPIVSIMVKSPTQLENISTRIDPGATPILIDDTETVGSFG